MGDGETKCGIDEVSWSSNGKQIWDGSGVRRSSPVAGLLRHGCAMSKNKPSNRNIAPIDLQLPAGVALIQVRRHVEFSVLAFVVKGN